MKTDSIKFCAVTVTKFILYIKKKTSPILFTAHAVKLKSNHVLKDEDQLTTCVKVFPSEVSLLWQEGSYSWLSSQFT